MSENPQPLEWLQVLKELDDLHDVRRGVAYYSIYHGVYVDQAIKLNKKLKELTGFSYDEHKYRQSFGNRAK